MFCSPNPTLFQVINLSFQFPFCPVLHLSPFLPSRLRFAAQPQGKPQKEEGAGRAEHWPHCPARAEVALAPRQHSGTHPRQGCPAPGAGRGATSHRGGTALPERHRHPRLSLCPPTAGMCVQLCTRVCRALTLGTDLPGLMCELTLLPPSWCLQKVWLLFPDPLPPTAELWGHHGAAFLIALLCLSLPRVSLHHCRVPPSPVPASQGVPQRWRG